MENTKFKIFILSIERNKNRYTSLLEKLKEQGFDSNIIEVFIGIDYKKVKIPSKIISPWGRYSPKVVLACAASHVLLWNYISKQDLDMALILEDDSYVIKSEFDHYFPEFKKFIDDETIVNLSTSLIVPEKGISTELFTQCLVILSLDTYMVTPKLCQKLFEFYKNTGLAYHIDLHLTFIKNAIPMKMLHFNKKITVGNMRLESTMVQGHDKKFLLKLLKGTESYKELNTPIIEYQDLVINGYHLIMLISFILILSLTFLIIKDTGDINFYNFTYLAALWLFLGFGIYDML